MESDGTSDGTTVGTTQEALSGPRIVVGVDGSEASCDALRFAVRQADLTGADVHAVISWEVPFAFASAGPEVIDWEGEARHRLDEALEETLPAERRDRVHRHVLRGHPSPVLRRMARGAELLVIGSRGHGGFTGLMLGSVGQYLVTHARCPTVVVHLDDLHAPEDEPDDAVGSVETVGVTG